MDSDIAKLFSVYRDNPQPDNDGICDLFTLSSEEQVVSLMQAYGRRRFIRKCARFNAGLLLHSFDQILYEGWMEAAGYDKNRGQMAELARHYPWQQVQNWLRDGLDGLGLAGIFLHYAGLMDKLDGMLGEECGSRIRKAFEYQPYNADKRDITWHLFRIRPAAHPVKRILQVALFLHKAAEQGLLSKLVQIAQESRKINQMVESIRELYLLSDNQDAEAPGKSFILTVAGNILLPVLALYAEKTGDKALGEKVLEWYMQFPASSDNYITHFMMKYMTESQKKIMSSSFAMQQGLLYLYYAHCRYRLCELCKQEKQQAWQEM